MNDIETVVSNAYRWILGRDVDSSGMEHYSERLRSGALTEDGLRRILIECPEFASARTNYSVVDLGNGLKVVVDPNEPEFGRYIAADGVWEAHIVEAIRANLKAGESFVDIGANVGVMSFNAAQAVGPQGKVIGFEPNPRNISAFRRGILANGFGNVLLYPFAVSDHREMIGVTSASNGKVIGDAVATQAADVIQAVPVDELLADEARVDLVKMDIEGYEPQALRGLAQTLARHKPMILLEFNPLCLKEQNADPAAFADTIFQLTSVVQLVEHDYSRTDVRSAGDLMALWYERDEVATRTGQLPAGWVHFDLLFKVD